MATLIAIGLILWLTCGVFAGVVAHSKGRSVPGWTLLGVFFGIFALIAVVGMPRVEPRAPASAVAASPAPLEPPMSTEEQARYQLNQFATAVAVALFSLVAMFTLLALAQ